MSKTIVFTQEQQKILAIQKGVHLVLAPPGSGKTELLAARVENAVNSGYQEHEIICLTFTNRAAKGMKERIESKFPGNEIIIGNIHHYCSNFLFSNKLLPQFTAILDEEDADQILEEAKAELGYPKEEVQYGNFKKPKVYNPALQKLNTYIKQKKLNFPKDLLVEPDFDNIPQIDLAELVCLKYESLKAAYDLMDFDDILTLTYKFLENKKDTYSICSFKWIQVDEVQDLNPLQWAILGLIANKECLRVYFGDYEQAIFSFMGAQLKSLHKVENECKTIPGNGIHNLQKNFRSPSYLLNIFIDYAQALLDPVWKKRPLANIIAEAGPNYLKTFTVSGGLKTEAEFITKKILPELRKDKSKTAIIVRLNDTADIISNSLTSNGIEHFKISGFDLFRRASVKGLMSFFSILYNEFDRMAWARIFYIFGKMDSLRDARGFANELFKGGLLPTDVLANNEPSLLTFSNSFNSGRLVVFDTETTGLDTSTDDIIQIAAIEIINGVPGLTFEVYIKTLKDLTATEPIHNISATFLHANGVDARVGLQSFMDFLGNDPVLVAHNLEYDHAILRSNLARHTGITLSNVVRKEIDTLKISKLIYPKLHSYKLKDLLTQLNIAGKNSHNAKDDVEATANLIIRMIVDAAPIIGLQKKLVNDNGKLLNRFRDHFKELYDDSILKFQDNVLLETIVDEYFKHSDDGMSKQEKAEVQKLTRHMSRIDRSDNTTSLKERINKYIPDYKRYKESDLITGDEQVYLSTVYKAKGLEFDNVIVAEAVDGIYPYWASNTREKEREDARALYVALSRAKKRLYITCHTQSTNQYGKVFMRSPSPFIDSIRHHFDIK